MHSIGVPLACTIKCGVSSFIMPNRRKTSPPFYSSATNISVLEDLSRARAAKNNGENGHISCNSEPHIANSCFADNTSKSGSTQLVHPSVYGLPESTVGRYLARRLIEIGIDDVFVVPGQSSITLLDQFIAETGLNVVGCCNELNAGYAADGYTRSRGVGACVFTYTVGGLSALNAIAGAYFENLPLICIVGGPNSNASHDFNNEVRCFQPITCHQAVINNLDDAREKIDTAIITALEESKPVYISISCNLPNIPHPSFAHKPNPFAFSPKISNLMSLEAAVEAAAELLNKAVKPVLVGGPKLRIAKACHAFMELASACGYAVAVMPSAKGIVSENYPGFIGTYWGAASTDYCQEIVESADAYLFAGPIFDEYSTAGNSLLLKKEKAIIVDLQSVAIANGPEFRCILMEEFFEALAKRLKFNTRSYERYCKMYIPEALARQHRPKESLKVNVLFKHIQKMLSSEMAVIAETGDSWLRSQKLKLPDGCRYESQMHYGSIGWSVGATLGYAQASPHMRVIACIGDGSFQMTGQEVSTMLRCGQRSIIFLINNGGYSTEVHFMDGPFNVIKNWDYTGLVRSISNSEDQCWTAKVYCEEELEDAIDMAMGQKKECLCFIEVIVDPHDTSNELLKLVHHFATANSLPPNHQPIAYC